MKTVVGRRLLIVPLAIAYAACFPAIKLGLAFAPPLMLAGARALVAGLALVLLLVTVRGPLVPARASWPWVLSLALTSTTLALGAMFLSPGHTGAGIASVLGNLQPVAVLALAAPVLGEPITRGKAAALALGFAGALLVSASTFGSATSSDTVGPLLAVAASLSVAAGNVLAKRMGAQPHLVAIAAWQLVLGSLPLLAVSAALERGASVRWDPVLVAVLLFLAVAGTALPTPIWYWLVRGGDDLGQLTLFLFLVPVFGLGLSAAIFGEPIGGSEILGTGVILVGIVVAAGVQGPPLVGRRVLALPCHCPSLGVAGAGESLGT